MTKVTEAVAVIPMDDRMMFCVDCKHKTNWLEAKLREFNPGRCAYCGGMLIDAKFCGDVEHNVICYRATGHEPPHRGQYSW